MNIKNFFVDGMEADDLIYAFCHLHHDKKLLIISSDSDFKQIPYSNNNVEVYNPLKKKIVDIPNYDCVVMKALIGDTADNIDGYYGLGEVKVKPLLEDYNKLEEFIKSEKAIIMEDGKKKFVGRSLFVNNIKLIDLSMCAGLHNNIEYIAEILNDDQKFDLKAIRELITKYNINGLSKEIPNTLIPFRKLMEMRNEKSTT
jgi:5'-3' exonuclease